MPKLDGGSDSLTSAWLRQTTKMLRVNGVVRDSLQLANIVRRGLNVSVIEELLARGLPERIVFQNVVKRRTYQHRVEGKQRLTPDESDRAERLASLLSLATIVFGDEGKASHWLSTPKERFERRAPLDVATSSVGARLVEEVLLAAYYGFAA